MGKTSFFKEGDVIVLRAGPVAAQDRGILLRNEAAGEGWWTICFVNRRQRCLDLSGILEGYLGHFRLATLEERREILSAMAGKKFGTHRGPRYFARWRSKLEKIVKPAIAKVLGG